jgi:hypothetical protein
LSNSQKTVSYKPAPAKRIAHMMQNPRRCFRLVALAAFKAVAMRAKGTSIHKNRVTFDTNSGPIGVVNQCMGCISHCIEDFEGPSSKSGQSIKGFGGLCTKNIKIGTIVWKWDDKDGRTHKFKIPYFPSM